jgi:hypothetical protein
MAERNRKPRILPIDFGQSGSRCPVLDIADAGVSFLCIVA